MLSELPIREAAADVSHELSQEWESRTWFGKLLYPIWLLEAALWWSVLLGFLLLILLVEEIFFGAANARRSAANLLPAVHEEEGDNV